MTDPTPREQYELDRAARNGPWEVMCQPTFWGMVDKQEGCWLWKGFLDRDGYGLFTFRHKTTRAHRVAYELQVAAIPEGMQIDHLCRTRHCVNPHHMEVVTHRENVRRGIWVKKTHCPRGHEYSIANTYMMPSGSRQCKACNRIHVLAYRKRRKK